MPGTLIPARSENEIQNEILMYLRSKRIFAWRNNSGGVYDVKKKLFRKSRNVFLINGVSDILGILRGGRFLAIEVKSRKGKASPSQLTFLADINFSGGLAFIARSVADVEKMLKDNL